MTEIRERADSFGTVSPQHPYLSMCGIRGWEGGEKINFLFLRKICTFQKKIIFHIATPQQTKNRPSCGHTSKGV
jgi:hypothetical protein